MSYMLPAHKAALEDLLAFMKAQEQKVAAAQDSISATAAWHTLYKHASDELGAILAEVDKPDENQEYIALARAEYQREGEIEIDDNAVVSISEDSEGFKGAYVQAWVYVDAPEHDGVTCRECGEPMAVSLDSEGVSNHITEDGTIDHDADADHVAVLDDTEVPANA